MHLKFFAQQGVFDYTFLKYHQLTTMFHHDPSWHALQRNPQTKQMHHVCQFHQRATLTGPHADRMHSGQTCMLVKSEQCGHLCCESCIGTFAQQEKMGVWLHAAQVSPAYYIISAWQSLSCTSTAASSKTDAPCVLTSPVCLSDLTTYCWDARLARLPCWWSPNHVMTWYRSRDKAVLFQWCSCDAFGCQHRARATI